MRLHRFEVVLATALALVFVALWAWLAPGDRGRLSGAEVDHYVARLRGRLPAPADEERVFLERLRAWASADDGRPVYMLNVMSYYPQLRRLPGSGVAAVSPAQANAHYEDAVMPMLLRRGGFPLFGGDSAGLRTAGGAHADLVGASAAVDEADRILVVRYPSRRAFLELISDPEYLKIAPYKFAALKLALVPLAGQTVLPDPRWIAGGVLLALFLAIGWWRATPAK
jgi:hypothetical protein